MNRAHRFTILLAALSLVLACSLTAAIAQSAGAARPSAVAVVDIRSLLQNLREREDLDAQLQAQVEQIQNTIEQRRKELATLKAEVDMLAPGEVEHSQGTDELQLKNMELQAWQQYQQQKIQREQVRLQEELYNKSIDGIAAVASDMGYDIVFYKDPDPQFEQQNPQAVGAQIQLRKVLWSHDSIDITQAVVRHLNAQYGN